MNDAAAPLEGARIRLRRLTPDDAGVFARYRADPVLARYQGWSAMTIDAAADFVREMQAAPAFVAGEWLQLAIADAASDRLIGDVGVCCAIDGSAEIGFTLARERHGRGLAHEALVLAMRLLFERTATTLVRGVTDARNTASARVLAAAGLRHVKIEDTVFRGQACTEWTFERRRDELALRRACLADAAALSAFAARNLDDTTRAGTRPEDHAACIAKAFGVAQLAAEIADPGALTLLAEDGLALAGCLQLDREPAPAGTAVAGAVHLSRLYVDRRWHGQGLAQRLVDEAARRAAAWGAPALWLAVSERDPRAIADGRQAGFEDVGTTPFDAGAGRRTDRVMQRRTSP